MCTFACLIGGHERYPLIVAANRDELRERPTLDWSVWEHEGVRIAGGRDAREGGTWMGLNEHGLLVALTNRFRPDGPDPGKASRGHLVRNLLAADSVSTARERAMGLDLQTFNEFNLFAGDAEGGWVLTNSPQTAEQEVGWGLVTLGNDDGLSEAGGKRERVRAAMERITPAMAAPEIRDVLAELLRSAEGRMERQEEAMADLPICIETPVYGTVSSAILLVAEPPERSRWWGTRVMPTQGDYTEYELSDLFGA